VAGQASRAASDELGQSPGHLSPPVPDLTRKSNGGPGGIVIPDP